MASVRRLVIAALALGCGGSSRQPEHDSKSPPATMSGWRSTTWQAHGDVVPGDLGQGVVFLGIAEDKGARNLEDTLVVRATPDSAAVPVGAMLFSVAPDGQTTYRVAAAHSLRPNLVEHGYEESGVPFDSTDGSGRWVRAILGYRTNDTALVGWVDSAIAGTGTKRWASVLAEGPIFFPSAEQAVFYSSPDSSHRVPSPRPEPEYAMYAEEARGRWLRVRVVQPSDLCIAPDSARRDTRTLWIRYLDDRGRPDVWYHTRGC